MADADPAPSADGRRDARRAALAIAPGVLLAGVAGGIAFPILPVVGVRAGLPLPLIGAILAANRIGRIVSGPAVGAAADRWGGRRLLVGGLVTQIAVMAMFSLGVRLERPGLFFLLGRALHGPGSACVLVAGQALALHAGGRAHGGLAASTVRVAMLVGVPLGLVAGGVLSARLGDASAFEAAGVATALAAAAAFFLVPERRAKVRAATPIREALRSMADTRLACIGALNFAVAFSAQGMVLTTLVLLLQARGVTFHGLGEKEMAGVLMGWMIAATAAATVLASEIAKSARAHTRVVIGSLVLLVAGLLVVGLSHGASAIAAGTAILGLGGGALGAAVLALVGELVDPGHRGAGIGLLQLCGDVGGALGPIAGTALFAEGVETAYVGCAAVVALFFPFAIYLARRAAIPSAPASSE